MRPGSAASLPDSTASTGLPCLSVGAREHHGRNDIEVDRMAATVRVSHLVCDIYNKEPRYGLKWYNWDQHGVLRFYVNCRVSSCPINPIKSYIFGIVL